MVVVLKLLTEDNRPKLSVRKIFGDQLGLLSSLKELAVVFI